MSVREIESTFIIQASFAANLPANNKVAATVLLDPALGAQSVVTIPASEAWVLIDLFVSSSQSVDAILEFKKNLTQSVLKTSPVNTLLVSNPSRPVPAPILYEPQSLMTIEATNLSAIGASPVTITVYAKFKRFVKA